VDLAEHLILGEIVVVIRVCHPLSQMAEVLVVMVMPAIVHAQEVQVVVDQVQVI